MRHETHGKRLTRYLQNYSEHARKRLKGSKRDFDWSRVDAPRGRALIGFSVAILWLVVIILMSEQI